MESSVSVIICSAKEFSGSDKLIEKLQNTSGCDITVYLVNNEDGIPLSLIYSDLVDSEDILGKVLLFMHDDVEVLKDGWGAELLRLFDENKEYGIIGVAGSAQFDENGAWWNYDKKYGQVLHRNEGKSWLTAFSQLLDKDLQEVAVVDGLFMAMHRDRIGANFSREIPGFDFYDIHFCLSNYIAGKCKIGVTTNIRVAHDSIGKPRDGWYRNRELVNEEFGEYFPIDCTKKNNKRKR